MSEPLTPDDAEDPLVEDLAYGIELEEQSINDVRTSFEVRWSDEYEIAIQNISRDGRFRSRTMCEMVIARQARKEFQDLKDATYTDWGTELKNLVICIDKDSQYYRIYKAKMDGAEKALNTISLGEMLEGEEYHHSATKEDINKLRYGGQKQGMYPTKKLHIGLALVVSQNKSLFPTNLVRNSEQIVRSVKSQYDSLRQSAISNALEAGRILQNAKEDGNVMVDDLESELESIAMDDKRDDLLYKSLKKGMNGSSNVMELMPDS